MVEVLAAVLSTALPSLLLFYWLRQATTTPPVDSGVLTLRYPRGLEVGGWILVLATVSVSVGVTVWFGVSTSEDVVSIIVFVLLSGGAGMAFVIARRREWVRVTAAGLEGQTAFAVRPTQIAWEDVAAIQFGKMSGYLTVRTKDGRSVRTSAFHVGSLHLADLIGRRLSGRGGAEAAAALREYRARYRA